MEDPWRKKLRLEDLLRQAMDEIARNAHIWQMSDALRRRHERSGQL